MASFGCHQRHKKKLISIKEYRVTHKKEVCPEDSTHSGTVTQNANDDFVFWYIITCNSNNSTYYYSYSSPTQVTNFSSVDWTLTQAFPVESANEATGTTVTTTEVTEPVSEMSTEMQTEMSENADYFGGMTESEMGDYEGTDTGTDSGSDTGGDSGGGDSGGDGGGGGD
jgi:hypothetical protein